MFALQPAINQFLPTLKLALLNFIIQFFPRGFYPLLRSQTNSGAIIDIK